jgi:hypothetical protein
MKGPGIHHAQMRQALSLSECHRRIITYRWLSQVLDECANAHAGMEAEERPIIGVRGQRKDLARVAKLIQARPAPNRACLRFARSAPLIPAGKMSNEPCAAQ